ncbi:MAG TPA: tetratricopeptide repeat protein [Candidatus Dormibacteraeota bacterium]|nr:tetratricopeptide repeat protein [Candidatus Dormibacteraeota bacterium]
MPASAAAQRANALMAVGRYPEAIRDLIAALASAPQDPELLCTLALAYLNSGHPKDGLQFSRRAVAAAPDDDWPYRLLSLALRRTGKPKAALDAAMAAQRINPESQLVLMSVAGAQVEARMTNEALGTANRAVAAGPENPDAYNLRGQVLIAQKRYAEAEADFRYALRMNPTDWVYNNNLGVVLRRQNKKKDAVEAFERAVRANPRARTARQNLFGSTSAYVGGGTAILLYVALRLGLLTIRSWDRYTWVTVAAGGVIFVVGLALWLLARHRRAQLSGTVDRFYALERRRRRGRYFLYVGWRLGPILLFFLLALLAVDLRSPYSATVLGAAIVFALPWWLISIPVWRHLVLPRLDQAGSDEG